MATPDLIGLYALPGAGKGAVADRLITRWGYSRVKFAAVLKDMAACFLYRLGYSNDQVDELLDGDLKESTLRGLNVTARSVMQTLGTEWGRKCVDEDVWVKLAMVQAEKMIVRGRKVVIDDMRFENEFKAVGKARGLRVAVCRPEVLRTRTNNGHEAEGRLENQDFDTVILNDFPTLDGLHMAVDKWMESYA